MDVGGMDEEGWKNGGMDEQGRWMGVEGPWKDGRREKGKGWPQTLPSRVTWRLDCAVTLQQGLAALTGGGLRVSRPVGLDIPHIHAVGSWGDPSEHPQVRVLPRPGSATLHKEPGSQLWIWLGEPIQGL